MCEDLLEPLIQQLTQMAASWCVKSWLLFIYLLVYLSLIMSTEKKKKCEELTGDFPVLSTAILETRSKPPDCFGHLVYFYSILFVDTFIAIV